MDESLISIAKTVLDRCLKKGISGGEVLAAESEKFHIEVDKSELDVIKDSTEKALAVRVLIDQCLGFATSTDFCPSSVDLLIEKVLTSARNTDKDLHHGFPFPKHSNIEKIEPERLHSIDVNEKIRRCKEMEKAAYMVDPRIKVARQISYTEHINRIYLINSNGVEVSYSKSLCSTFAMVVAQEKEDSQMSWEIDIQTSYNRLKWSEIAQEAANRALGRLGARSISTRRASVVISPYAAASLLGAFAPAFYADSVQKRRSPMTGRIGEIVGSCEVDLIDDGTLPEGLSTVPYDGEGVPMQKTAIIEKGRLKSYLYDTYTAHKEAVASTGNGVRIGVKTQPQVGATNMYIKRGSYNEEELLALLQEGLYVNEVIGAHTINPISGDFSIGATGQWIEKGKTAFPVRGVTLSGNIIDILTHLEARGDNLRFFGDFGSPSIVISDMIISGESGGN